MAKTTDQAESIRIAHLSMVQGIITRMGTNSFTIKVLSATIGSAGIVISTTAKNFSIVHMLVAIMPVLFLWKLDAQYLRYERAYIKLYDSVRKKRKGVDEYSLNMQPFLKEVDSVFCTAMSWSLRQYYLALLSLIIIVSILNLKEVSEWLSQM